MNEDNPNIRQELSVYLQSNGYPSAGSLQTPCPAALSVSYTKSHSACTDKRYGDTGGDSSGSKHDNTQNPFISSASCNASAIDKPMP